MQQELLDADTLNLLRDSLERYARARYGFDQRRERLATRAGFGVDAWRDYAEMGWLAMPSAVEDGGFGSAAQAIGALMQYVGGALALEPVFASVVLCGRVFGLCEPDASARQCLQSLAEGRAVYALAHVEDPGDALGGEVAARVRQGRLNGRKLVVLHGDSADHLVVSARDEEGAFGLFLVDAAQPQIRRDAYRLVDGRGAANIAFEAAACTRIASGSDAERVFGQALDDARLALCAEAYGACKALNALTLAYLKDRRQFGRAIGTNQALQHRVVELYLLEEEGRAVIGAAYRASGCERRVATLAALAHVMTLARQASHEAVQLHGGIGMTEELAVSHYFRRLMVINRLLGDREQALQSFAEAAAADAGAL